MIGRPGGSLTQRGMRVHARSVFRHGVCADHPRGLVDTIAFFFGSIIFQPSSFEK